MSFHAMAWAAKQKTGGMATKAALMALANYADELGCSYPSTAAIAEFGEMDHKTATAALDRLLALGLIADSGERAGRTKQIKVYRLALESQPETEASQKRKPSGSSGKAPQKRGTDTIRDTGSSSETASPTKTRASAPRRRWPRDMPPPTGVSDEQWAGFVEHRKRLRAGLTPRAYDLLCGKLAALARDGWPPGDMIDRAVEHGWKSVFPPDENRNGNRTLHDRPSGWAPRPGMEGAEPADLDF